MQHDAIPNYVWMGAAGAMLVLLRSIIDGTRRVWYRLVVGCLLGGLGAAMAGHVFEGSPWVYPICGVAAIITENVMLGLFNASSQFRDDPVRVFTHFWKLVMPTFGKATGDSDAPPKPAEEKPIG